MNAFWMYVKQTLKIVVYKEKMLSRSSISTTNQHSSWRIRVEMSDVEQK